MSNTAVARAILLLDDIADFLVATGGDQSATLARQAVAMARQLRHHTEDIEKLIRDCAARGLGKQETQLTLGMSRYRFDLLISALPDIQWVSPNQTAGRRGFYDSLKGRQRPPGANQAAVRASVLCRQKYNLCGVQGSARDLYNLWSEYVSVGYSTVNRRLSQGDNLYDALFSKHRPSAVDQKMTPARKAAYLGVHKHA